MPCFIPGRNGGGGAAPTALASLGEQKSGERTATPGAARDGKQFPGVQEFEFCQKGGKKPTKTTTKQNPTIGARLSYCSRQPCALTCSSPHVSIFRGTNGGSSCLGDVRSDSWAGSLHHGAVRRSPDVPPAALVDGLYAPSSPQPHCASRFQVSSCHSQQLCFLIKAGALL